MNSLKKKFGKFAVSNKIVNQLVGGNPEPVAVSYDGAGGGSSNARWACSYSSRQYPVQRTQICPNKNAADDFKFSMENIGFLVSCFALE